MARLTFVIFVVLQLADGLITFGAVRIFGFIAEGNPLLVGWMQLAGVAPTLLTAKGIACAGAVVLYATGRHKTLAVLTAMLLCCAIGPWLMLLASFR